ncbi:MAG: Ig-like domain-containing protein [Clostridia bacterium]|nr:Ig-like domain-containing protein [Clostridia bacterium]
MNNEEMNSSLENEGVEDNNVEEKVTPAPQSKRSGGLIAAIIGGIAVVLVALILLIVLIPKGNGNDGGNDGGTSQDGGSDDKGDGKVKYTVTVVDQEGNPVAGVQIFFAPKDGTSFPMATNDNGVANYTTAKELTVSVLSVPTGYEYDKLAQSQQFDKDGNLKITVNKVEKEETGTKYTIRVVDQDGNAVVGAKVQMCEAENAGVCLVPVTTDENGEAFYNVEEKGYKAAITELPDGYEKINDDYAYFENGVATITVTKTAD